MKRLSLNQIEQFTLEVIGKLNINMTDPENEFKIFSSEIQRYAAQSKITSDEFFLARTLLSRGMLADVDGEILKPYKKIDFEMFNVVEEAYLRYKADDKQYEAGKAQIKAFLNPPPPEPTPEQKAEQRRQLTERIKAFIKTDGVCEFAFLIYDDLKDLPEFQKHREKAAEFQSAEMRKFLAKERNRNLFYNKFEVQQLTELFESGKKYKMPGAVYQETKNRIIESYYKQEKDL